MTLKQFESVYKKWNNHTWRAGNSAYDLLNKIRDEITDEQRREIARALGDINACERRIKKTLEPIAGKILLNSFYN